MEAQALAKILQDILLEEMEKYDRKNLADPLRKMPWDNLDPLSRQLYILRAESFLERFEVIEKPAQPKAPPMSYGDWLMGQILNGILASGQFKVPTDTPWEQAPIIAENALEMVELVLEKREQQ